ncbi:MAG: DNA adenine methylase [Bacteroidales bacterium]|jgi:DNA adenine methylase|nr:DNA adenine methylase [Bacteroidales bacterium]
MFYSPLRYPGGKNKLAAFIAKICIDNSINGHYIEPYAGGASVALFLLFEGYVSHITINDKDRSIYAFWYSVLNHTDELCHKIATIDISIDTWYTQKKLQQDKESINLLDLGFSTLFLNRTNHSGIITGGPIGGIEQKGKYKINCRFNKGEIINRIKKIANNKERITLYQKDAIDLIDIFEIGMEENNIIIYFDPPYYLKADSLYMNFYKSSDHLEVSERIKKIKKIKWILSYDNINDIKKIYSHFLHKEYSFKHTAYKARVGNEILFFSENLILTNIPNWNPLNFKYIKHKIIYKQKRHEFSYLHSWQP